MELEKALQEYPEAFIDFLDALLTDKRKATFTRVLDARTSYISLLAEHLYDEQNLHALVRTAECLGVQHIHTIERDKKLKPAKKVSRGSHKWIDLHYYKSDEAGNTALLQSFKDAGYRLVATTPDVNGLPPEEIPLDKPVMLMLGEEKFGLSKDAVQAADLFIHIPMYGFTESYNLSVATAMCLYPIIRNLHRSNINWHLTAEERKVIWKKWVLQTVSEPHIIYKQWKRDNML